MENIHVRKIQITGGSTFIISLPKNWVSQMALEKGSLVSLIVQNNGSLLIDPKGEKEILEKSKASLKIEMNDESTLILRKIVSTYLIGYNRIHISVRNGKLTLSQRNRIKGFVRQKLVGTEIIEDSSEEMTLKVLLSYSEISVQNALRRTAIIAAAMHEDAVRSLKDFDKELAREVIAMDDEVDRFALYVIRELKAATEDEKIFGETGFSSRREILGYRLITKSIERTADHAVNIAENVVKIMRPFDNQIIDEIIKTSSLALSVFEEAMESLFRKDPEQANKIVQQAEKIAEGKDKLMNRVLEISDIKEVASLSLIIESVSRTIEYASDIAEIVMNMNIEELLTET